MRCAEFAKKLKDLRKDRHVSQRELAEYLHLTPNSICEWENLRSEPSIDLLIKLSNYFQCSLDYLLGREDDFGNIVVQGTEDPFFTTPQEQEFIIKLRSLSSSTREMILHVLDNAVQVEKHTSS